MASSRIPREMSALAFALSLAATATAADFGSVRYNGPHFTEARIDDGTWHEANVVGVQAGYGSVRVASEGYGHEYDNAVSSARRRASHARGRANDNAHKWNEANKPVDDRPTVYGSTLQEGHLTISRPGRGGHTVDEAMANRTNAAALSPPPPPVAPIHVQTPQGMIPVFVRDDVYYYRPCEFFSYEGTTLAKVDPPAGALIFDLSPEATSTTTPEGFTSYECGGAVYRKVMVHGSLVYQVAPAPN